MCTLSTRTRVVTRLCGERGIRHGTSSSQFLSFSFGRIFEVLASGVHACNSCMDVPKGKPCKNLNNRVEYLLVMRVKKSSFLFALTSFQFLCFGVKCLIVARLSDANERDFAELSLLIACNYTQNNIQEFIMHL